MAYLLTVVMFGYILHSPAGTEDYTVVYSNTAERLCNIDSDYYLITPFYAPGDTLLEYRDETNDMLALYKPRGRRVSEYYDECLSMSQLGRPHEYIWFKTLNGGDSLRIGNFGENYSLTTITTIPIDDQYSGPIWDLLDGTMAAIIDYNGRPAIRLIGPIGNDQYLISLYSFEGERLSSNEYPCSVLKLGSGFYNNIIVAMPDYSQAVLDEAGNELLPPAESGNFSHIGSGFIELEVDDTDDYITIYNSMGEVICQGLPHEGLGVHKFSEGLYPCRGNNGMYCYIDTTGNRRIPCMFEEARSFSDGLAAVRDGENWGYIDSSGNFVIEPQYQGASDFSGGYGAVHLAGQGRDWRAISSSGHLIGSEYYHVTPEKYGLFTIHSSQWAPTHKWGVMDSSGRIILGFDEGGYRII